MAYSLQARVVFPVDRPPIEHGVVTIDGERIVAVGAKTQASDVTDLGNVALLPGLVNAHTHLEFSYLRKPLGQPGMPFDDWIRLVIAERGRGDNSAQRAIENGVRESLECGVTDIGEITAIESTAYHGTCIGLTLFAEVIGFSRARMRSALSAVEGRLLMQQTLHDRGARATAYIHFGISPHAPFTVSPELLKKLVSVASDLRLPVAMHLAESTDELELLRSGTGRFQKLLAERSMWDSAAIPCGSRPLDYLRMLTDAPRALVIHGNYLDLEERAYLGANADRMSLVYCPRTHAYFAHPPYPLAELLASGVRVALGTDSRASNPDLDLLAEMRFVAKTYAEIDPRLILRAGTLAGAEALGRAGEVGSIAPGKLANLVAVPLPSDERRTPDELLMAILAGGEGTREVWVRGRAWSDPATR